MPSKSGPAPKAETNQNTSIVGANGGVAVTPPRLAGG